MDIYVSILLVILPIIFISFFLLVVFLIRNWHIERMISKKGTIIETELCNGVVTKNKKYEDPEDSDRYYTEFKIYSNKGEEIVSNDSYEVYCDFKLDKKYQFNRVTAIYKKHEKVYYECTSPKLTKYKLFL